MAEITLPLLLSIGTSEPWVAAGITLDVYLAASLRVRPLHCIVAVSAQDGKRNFSVEALSPQIVQAQLAAIADAPYAAVRVGALNTASHIDLVADFLASTKVPTVLDPVLASSSGGVFLDSRLLAEYRRRLLPRVTLLTPNLYETEQLVEQPVRDLAEMERAARMLGDITGGAVLVKGGHLVGEPVNVLWHEGEMHRIKSQRIAHDMRGTGCAFACAAAAALAHERSMLDAVRYATEIVHRLILSAQTIHGNRLALPYDIA